jgi:peptidoglycan/LPS O-acetylase OafA/YrhL
MVKKEEILPLSLLRFLAACMVVSIHLYASLAYAGYVSRGFRFLNEITKYGYLGVDLFFIISGFVITLSIENKTLGEFISARFLRLFPVFWLCVSITSLFMVTLGKGIDQPLSFFRYLANLTMVPHLYGGYDFLDGVYWTLAIELKFYIVVAWVFLLRSFSRITIEKVALLAMLPLLYYTFFYNPFSPSIINVSLGYTFRYYSEGYAVYFLAGVLFYSLYKNGGKYYTYTAIVICYIVAFCSSVDRSDYFQYSSPTLINPAVVTGYLTAFFGFFFLVSLKKINNESFMFIGSSYKKILITLGAVTYPLYLLHSKILYLIIQTGKQHDLPSFVVIFIICSLVTTLVLLANRFDVQVRTVWRHAPIFKRVISKMMPMWLKKVLELR